MQCLQIDIKAKRLNFIECPLPKITSDNESKVVIKVVLCGLCGTDLHIVEGKFPVGDKIVLGHEFVGTVSEVAKNERSFKVGDRVAVKPNYACGVCEECRSDMPNFCRNGGTEHAVGIFKDGGFAQYCKVRTSLVFKLNDDLRFEQAVFAEPLSCILHAIDLMPHQPHVGWKILVMGAGIIGLLWSCLLHHLGHRNVVVAETSETRRQSFKKLNLDFPILSWDKIDECAKQCKDWAKFNLIIDCSGNPDALHRAFPMLREKGVLLLFGVADPEKSFTVSPYEMFAKELTIVGVKIQTTISFQQALDMLIAMGTRYISEERLNTKTYKLEEHEEALKDLNNRLYSKVLFEFT